MRYIFNVFLAITTALVSVVSADELPFGSYGFPTQFDLSTRLPFLHDSLGFNYFWNHWSISEIQEVADSGITVIYAGGSGDAVGKNSYHHWARIQAEDTLKTVRLYNCGGSYPQGEPGYWASDYTSDMLYGPNGFKPPCSGWAGGSAKYYIKTEKEYYGHAYGSGEDIPYWVDVCLKIDEIGSEDAIVCSLKIVFEDWKGFAQDTTGLMEIRAFDFESANTPDTFGTASSFTIPSTAVVCTLANAGDCDPEDDDHWVTIEDPLGVALIIQTMGTRKVSVDWISIWDERGKSLVEDDDYSDDIATNAATYDALGEDIWGWNQRDEPFYSNIPVIGAIGDTIKGRFPGNEWRYISAIHYSIFYNYWFDWINTGVITPDIYPYTQYGDEDPPKYAGYGSGLKMQNRLNTYTDRCSLAYDAASNNNGEFWIIPQCFQGESYNNPYAWRKPTKSELSCQTYIALASGARGILYWKYGWSGPDDDGWISGIYDTLQTRTDLWDAIRYDINPYVKAIDATYMGLTWDDAYYVNPGETFPSGKWISLINTWSHPDTANPDTGWYHVGQFTEGSDKYIMLVNRACSQGEDNATAAPSVTATVKFNPTNLGLGPYVYIIDIADSIFFQSYEPDSFWADTTYSVKMSDGTIPFTTVLGPGEGRLFKIVQTTSKTLSGEIDTQYKYQGRITVSGDITVPADETMEILGPARFEIYRCDDQDGGEETTLAELIINGKLLAMGTPNDSIIFYPDTQYTCDMELLSNPQAGDWYGIIDKSADRDTLSYCVIKWAYEGFFADSTSNAVLRHCNISKNELASIYLEYTYGTKTWIDTCLISENDNSGIYAKESFFVATGNTITMNSKNGVYINLPAPSPSPARYELAYNNITEGIGYTTNYGVNVSGSSTSHPAVVFEANSIQDFNTAGVYLYRVADGDWDTETGTRFTGYNHIDSNDKYGLWCNYSSNPVIYTDDDCSSYNTFSYNSIYGIYCSNSSSPKIKKTKLIDNDTSNVACANFSSPNLGDTSSFDGHNDFNTVNYDIYIFDQTVIKAQGNYWGDEVPYPDTLDFYPNKSHVAYDSCRTGPCVPTGKREGLAAEIPGQFALYQNYPNPFNPATSIAFDLPEGSHVKISIYNILGQRVQILADEYYNPGHHVVVWDSRNRYGKDVSSGVYFYLIETSQFADARKMLILR